MTQGWATSGTTAQPSMTRVSTTRVSTTQPSTARASMTQGSMTLSTTTASTTTVSTTTVTTTTVTTTTVTTTAQGSRTHLAMARRSRTAATTHRTRLQEPTGIRASTPESSTSPPDRRPFFGAACWLVIFALYGSSARTERPKQAGTHAATREQ